GPSVGQWLLRQRLAAAGAGGGLRAGGAVPRGQCPGARGGAGGGEHAAAAAVEGASGANGACAAGGAAAERRLAVAGGVRPGAGGGRGVRRAAGGGAGRRLCRGDPAHVDGRGGALGGAPARAAGAVAGAEGARRQILSGRRAGHETGTGRPGSWPAGHPAQGREINGPERSTVRNPGYAEREIARSRGRNTEEERSRFFPPVG